MRRKFTMLTAALALLAFLTVPMGMRGQTREVETFTFSELGYDNGDTVATVEGEDVTLTFAQGTNSNNAPKYYSTGTGVRMYTGNTLDVALNNQEGETRITAINFTFSGTYTGSLQNWTGSETSVSFTNTASGQARIQVIAVTFSEGGVAPTTYTVTYNANVTGVAPVVDTYAEGATVTLRGADTFTNEGFTFEKWNTDANGDGDAYSAGDVIENIDDNIVLYAIWTENTTPSGETATLNIQAYATANNWVNGTKYTTATVDPVTFTANGGSNTGKYYTSGQEWRYYQGENASITISVPEGFALVSVKPTYNVSNGGVLKNGDATIASGTTVNVSGTSVTFTVGNSGTATNGQVRFTNIDVVYVSEGGVIPPSITAANVEIAYDATSGSIVYTINNVPDPAGTLTASTESDWLTLPDTFASPIEFTCTANEVNTERTATVTLTYAYGDNQAVTKEVTVTQAGDSNAVNNISDITETNHAYTVRGTVVATNARGFIIGDGTGYVYTYLNAAPTQSVGDNLFISGTTGSYGHVIQFTNAATIDTVAETNYNGEPQPIVITEVPDYSQGYHLSTYLQFEGNLTKSGSNYEVAIGESKIRISYPTTDQTSALAALVNKTVRVHGFFAGISGNNGNSVFTAMMESVEDMTPVVPSVTVTPSEINAPYTETEGALAITYENIPELISFDYYFCDAEGNQLEDTDSIYPTWIYAEINEENETYTLSYIIEENDGEARTAYLKVYTFVGEDEVYAIVTINQEEYVAPTYAELPFAFNYGRDSIPGIDGLSQNGLGTDYNTNNTKLKFDGTGDWLLLQFDERPGTLTFDIKGNSFSGSTFTVQTSEDGTTYTDKKVYTELSGTIYDTIADLDAEVRYIKWIYTNKSSGNVGLGNITLAEYVEPVIVASITVNPDVVNVNAEEHDGTLTLAYENLTITEMSDFDIQYYNAEGQEAETPDWIEVLVAEQDPQIGEGYVVSYYMLENEGEARTAYFKVYAMDDETNLVHSNLVTINQEAYVAPVPSITITPDTVNLDAGQHYMNLLDLAYENIEVEGPSSFTVHYYNAEGDEIELVQGEAWLVAGVVMQDDVYQVLFAVVANYGEARTVYFRVSCGETYSNLVTVTQAAPVLDYAVLPFEWAGGERSAFEDLNGTSTYGVGDYAATQGVYRMKLDNNGDYIMVKTNGQPGLVTIGVKMVGGSNTSTITIQGSADGETFTDIEELTISGTQNDTLTLETTNVFDANDRYVRMLFTRGSNVGVGPITIAKGTAPSINIAPANFDLEAVGDLNGMQVASGFVTYNNIDITQASDFHIQFYNAEGIEQEKPEWILGAAVSQIANSYQVACMIAANNGVARSTYYKVYAFDADSIPVYSNLVTINQAGVPQPSITFDPDVIGLEAEMQTIQIPFTYENIAVTNYESFTVHHYDAEGQEIQPDPETPWYIFGVTGTNDEGYKLTGLVTANEGEARSAYLKVSALDADSIPVYSNLVTINQEAPFTGVTYTLATSIEPGKHYIIVGEETVGGETSYYAMGQQSNNNRTAVEVTVDEGVAQVESGDVYEFVISGSDSIYLYTIYDATTPGYLYAASSSSNYLKTRASNSDGNSQWTITFETEGNAVITAQGSNTRKLMRYNSSNDVFSCYSSGQQPVYLYVKDEDKDYNFYSNTILAEVTIADGETYTVHKSATLDVTAALTNNGTAANLIIKDGAQLKTPNAVHGTIQKNIVGYGADNENTKLGYYLLKSPVPGMMNLTLAIESGMVNGTVDNPDFTGIDLYQFSSQKEEEWQNERIDQYFAEIGIPANAGYLYANVNDVTLSFATFEEEEQGQMNQHLFNATTTDVSTMALRFGNAHSFDGWNLIGNPYTCNAYLRSGRDFYRMNSTGDAIVLATENVIKPCEGIFVVVSENDPETAYALPTGEVLANVYFTTTEPQRANAFLDVTVSRNDEMLDAARVRFDNGNMIDKMVFNERATRLSIPQSGKDYSVVRSEAKGEMPVNFKAETNGSYTFSVNTDDVEMNYLHLIDNITGNDVDLLQTPNYTFEASTTDYASRFRIVFSATESNSTSSESFAYFNGSTWMVSNTGEATLQVVDMMGRVLRSENFSGNAEINLNQAAGVYVLRLVNGENVRTQKIVVK